MTTRSPRTIRVITSLLITSIVVSTILMILSCLGCSADTERTEAGSSVPAQQIFTKGDIGQAEESLTAKLSL